MNRVLKDLLELHKLKKDNQSLQEKIKQLKSEVSGLKSEKSNSESTIEKLKHQLSIYQRLRFGKKSEKLSKEDELQGRLFNESEAYSAQAEKESKPSTDEVETKTNAVKEQKRKKPGRKAFPENWPREKIEHDLNQDEKQCECGRKMKHIGQDISEKLKIKPELPVVEQHIRHKYACKHCADIPDKNYSAIKIAGLAKCMIPKSVITPSLLAMILVRKFCDALPFYRQENIFKRIGVEISRASMCNWTVQTYKRCNRLLKLLALEAGKSELLGIDETSVQVLKEPGKRAHTKSYMWAARAGPSDKPIVLFRYRPNRKSHFLKRLLKKYKGNVLTDGYSGYNFLDTIHDIRHAACWVHARRKFVEIESQKGCGPVIKLIGKLYKIEKDAKEQDLNPKAHLALRQEKSRPVVKEIKKWLDQKSITVPPKSPMGQAVAYSLGQWKNLEVFLEDAAISLDNNLTENAIRPFVIGRKNWLFSDTVWGARASAGIYSLIETAKANGLEPYNYLCYLFTHLPLAQTDKQLLQLLPPNLDARKINGVVC